MTTHQHDLSRARWRKSARSQDANTCVEVAPVPTAVAVRDSKDPSGPALVFSPDQWRTFTDRVKRPQV